MIFALILDPKTAGNKNGLTANKIRLNHDKFLLVFSEKTFSQTLISFQTLKSAQQLLRVLTGRVATAQMGSEMDDFGQSGPNILFAGPGVFQIWTGRVCMALKMMFVFWFE